MPNAKLVDAAEAVKAMLAASSVLTDASASVERAYVPLLKLESLTTGYQVEVIARTSERSRKTRTLILLDHTIDVGIVRRVATDADVDVTAKFAEDVAAVIEDTPIADFPLVTCSTVPMYDPKELLMQKVYVVVIRAVYRTSR